MEAYKMKHSLTIALFTCALGISGCGKEVGVPAGSGFIEATQTVVGAETSGRIESIHLSEGSTVNKGDTIASVDTTMLSLQLKQAKAARKVASTQVGLSTIEIEMADRNLALARTEFERVARLLPTGSVNQQQYDQAENQLDQAKLNAKRARARVSAAQASLQQAESQVGLLQKQLSDCHPVAPISGVVTETFVEIGELVAPGKALIEISQLDTVTVKIYLPPRDLTKFKLGTEAEVDPENGRETPLVGHVSWIAAEAEFTPKNVQTKDARADLVYAVKIRIPNKGQDLKIGMPVAVRIP
jgi:HlyD family secretion protein